MLFFVVGSVVPSSHAQEVTLRGFVVDTETGQPLPGANVLIRGMDVGTSPRGAAANNNGYYYFSDLVPGRYVLQVSFVGYRTLRDTVRLADREEPITHSVELDPAEQSLEELVITDQAGGATMRGAGRQQLAANDLPRIPTPSISGGLAGYLQSMPGVVSVGDRGGQLFIRGGTPDQNLILMDKMKVFRPFHIVGFYSAFPRELISNAQVYAGGFPARYNGRLSSVIDVEMRGGNQEQVEAAATVGPFLTGVRMEGPLNDEGLSLLGTARFSQIERTAPVVLGQSQPLKFDDQFVKLQNSFETGRCGVSGLHTYDRGQVDPAANTVFRWSNYAFGGRCVATGAGSASLVDVSISSSYTRNAVGAADTPQRRASVWDFTTKLDVSNPLEGGQAIRGGFQLHMKEMGYRLGEKFRGLRAADENWISLSGHLQAHLRIREHLDLRPGFAVTLPFGFGPSLEPRVRVNWRPLGSKDQELSAAAGLYRQTVVGLTDERDIGSVFTAWVPTPLEWGRPTAWHAILGWHQQIGALGFSVEGYYKDLKNLAVPRWSTLARFTTTLTAADGTSWGADFRGEFERGSIYAYVSYGFSWTRYRTAQENFGVWFGTDIQSYHPPHDRRHEVNAVLSADLGVATADVRWQMGAGLPYTRPFGYDAYVGMGGLLDPSQTYGTPRVLYEKPYRGRLPAYHRLDVSLTRTLDLNGIDLTAKAGAINLYDRQNLFYFDLFTQRRVNQLPLVPYAAVEIKTD